MTKNPLPYWVGPEVEGRLTGVETLFVQDRWPPLRTLDDYTHIYVGFSYVEKQLKNEVFWHDIRALLVAQKLVTLEINSEELQNAIPPDVFNKVHILRKVAAPGCQRLKPTDTISCCGDSYHVLVATRMNLQEVEPEDYAHDKPI
jgi:hypothetical protein